MLSCLRITRTVYGSLSPLLHSARPPRGMRLPLKRILSTSDQRVARQTFWLNAISVIRLLGGIAQISITAKMLGVEGYGTLAAIVAFCALIHGIIAIPSGDTVTTFVTRSVTAGHEGEAARIVRFAIVVPFGLSFVAYAVITALTLFIADLMGTIENTYATAVLLYGVVGILGSTSSGSLAILRLSDRVSLGSMIAVLAALMRLGTLGLAWYLGGGLTSVIYAHIAGEALYGLGMLISCALLSKRAGIEGLFRSSSVRVPTDVLRFGIGSFGKSALVSTSSHLDSILLLQLTGVSEVGVYRASRQMVDFARQPFRHLSSGFKMELSRLWYSKDGVGLRRMLFRFTVFTVVLSVSGFAVLALFRTQIVQVILGSDFAEVTSPLLIMIIGSFIVACASPLISLPPATGRISPSVIAETAGLVASVIAILLLVPGYLVQGAAWANTVKLATVAIVLMPYAVSIIKRPRQRESNYEHNDHARMRV